MAHTISHTAVLDASADDLWEVILHVDTIFGDLMPEFIAQNSELIPQNSELIPQNSELIQVHGDPGSIRGVTTEPVMQPISSHRLPGRFDKFDHATKTLGYTLFDPRYGFFSAEFHFAALRPTRTQATWKAAFTPSDDEMGPDEDLYEIAQVVFETLEEEARAMKKFTHTATLQDVTPDAMWTACEFMDEILLKDLPQHFQSVVYDQFNHGGPGVVRTVKFGPAITFAEEVAVRLDLMDRDNRKIGFTMLKGDPRFKLYTATMEFKDGPRGYNTTAEWKVNYITVGDEDISPIYVKNMVVTVWETLASTVNADPELYGY